MSILQHILDPSLVVFHRASCWVLSAPELMPSVRRACLSITYSLFLGHLARRSLVLAGAGGTGRRTDVAASGAVTVPLLSEFIADAEEAVVQVPLTVTEHPVVRWCVVEVDRAAECMRSRCQADQPVFSEQRDPL